MTARIPWSAGRLKPLRRRVSVAFLSILLFSYCLSAYSAGPKAAPGLSTNTPGKPKPMMVVVTNRMQTLKGWFGPERPFPILNGNSVIIEQVTLGPLGGMETHSSWRVVNMLAENLTEILKRLGTETIEMAIYPKTNYVYTFQGRDQFKRKVNVQSGYAVITDARIPRDWFLFTADMGNFPSIKPDQILTDFPQSFREIRTETETRKPGITSPQYNTSSPQSE